MQLRTDMSKASVENFLIKSEGRFQYAFDNSLAVNEVFTKVRCSLAAEIRLKRIKTSTSGRHVLVSYLIHPPTDEPGRKEA